MDKLKQTLLDLGVKNLILKEDGKLVWQFLSETERLFNQYSVTKAFTALAVLEVCATGLLSLDDSVLDLLQKLNYEQAARQNLLFNQPANLAISQPETVYTSSHYKSLVKQLRQAELRPLTGMLSPKAKFAQLTLGQLLNMTSGHSKAHMFISERSGFAYDFNWFDFCVHLDFARRPGSHFLYTNAGPYMAGVIVQAFKQKRLSEILAELFAVGLNLQGAVWKQDTSCYEFGASELFLSTNKLSDFAEIMRQGGLGYVSKDTVRQATTPSYVDEAKGIYYGYGFWLYPDGAYRADGSHGQYIMVDAKRKRSLAVNGFAHDERSLKDLLYREFIAN